MPFVQPRIGRPARLLPGVAALVITTVLAALGAVVVTASAAQAVPPQQVTLCLANASSFGADVKNSADQSGTPISAVPPQ
jgi:hypothetical protein